jgi:hypothetical protein
MFCVKIFSRREKVPVGRMRGYVEAIGAWCSRNSFNSWAAALTRTILQPLRSNPSSVGEYAATFSRREKAFTLRN